MMLLAVKINCGLSKKASTQFLEKKKTHENATFGFWFLIIGHTGQLSDVLVRENVILKDLFKN